MPEAAPVSLQIKMSNVYIHEPNTTGKVLIQTTYGDIEVELWCKEAPLACRNFIQLAMEGYYDETAIHRVVPKFIIQAGDPTGTGTGGASIYGQPFKIEPHSRLAFGRRGLLGMASTAESGECTSQFFFTLDKAPELDRKSTLFGKIVGDTIYNLLRIADVEVDAATERPLYPPVITEVKVLLNPFEDIIPRDLPEVRERRLKAKPQPKAKPAAIALKNKSLLSFQDEEEEDDAVTAKIMSSHDALNDPTLSKRLIDTTVAKKLEPAAKRQREPTEYEQAKAGQRAEHEKIEQDIAAVQGDIRRMANLGPAQPEAPAQKPRIDSVSSLLGRKPKGKSYLQEQQELYKKKAHAIVGKRQKSAVDDVNTLLTLNAFKEKLQHLDTTGSVNLDATKLAKADAPRPADTLDICKLHGLVNCLSCRDTFGVKDDGETEEGWLMHRLVFDKEVGYKELEHDLTNLVVIDPREKAKEILGRQKNKSTV